MVWASISKISGEEGGNITKALIIDACSIIEQELRVQMALVTRSEGSRAHMV